MMDPPYTSPKMEVRGRTESAATVVPREVSLDEEGFVYGSRWVRVGTGDGFQEVPLTWEDLFDPQEGDHVPHGTIHGKTISETKESLIAFFDAQGRDDVLVCDDVKMLWSDPKIPRVGPDVAVIPGVEEPKRSRKSFDERREGTRPTFVLEVTSEATAVFDRRHKPEIYRRAQVRECLVLDQLTSPWKLTGYRLDVKGKKYLTLRPDKRGRYLAKTLGVYFRVAESGEGLLLQDAATGEVLLKPVEESRARRAAERQAEEARQAAEAAGAKIRELLAKIERLEATGKPS